MLLILFMVITALMIYTIDKELRPLPEILTVIQLILVSMTMLSYMSHAVDLGTIRAQNEVVKVYEKRIQALKADINELVPEMRSTNVLLNADSPVKAMIDQLAKANEELAAAEATKAVAIRSIARRDAGPFWFVVALAGSD